MSEPANRSALRSFVVAVGVIAMVSGVALASHSLRAHASPAPLVFPFPAALAAVEVRPLTATPPPPPPAAPMVVPVQRIPVALVPYVPRIELVPASRPTVRPLPSDDVAWYARSADRLLDQGLLAEADRHLDRADELVASHPQPATTQALVLAVRGRHYLDSGRARQARRLLSRAATLDPRLPEAHFYLAQIAIDLGQRGQACTEILRVLSVARMGPLRDRARQDFLEHCGRRP
jgi:hypothetical protein